MTNHVHLKRKSKDGWNFAGREDREKWKNKSVPFFFFPDTLYPSGYGRWINRIRFFFAAGRGYSFTYMISNRCTEAVSGTWIAFAGGNLYFALKQLLNGIEYVNHAIQRVCHNKELT
jgi:hypothetical protein